METKQNEYYKPARENGLKLCSPIHRMIDLSTGSSGESSDSAEAKPKQ
jgi:hypothetical protein